MFIAHRGLYNKNIRENTLLAFDNAFNNGYEGIELDVRKTKDGKVVVIHDSFISRVSNGFGLVKDYTYEELLKFNFGGKKEEKIVLLSDVVNRYQNKTIIIELKDDIDVSGILNKKNDYYISSFNYSYIKKYKKSKDYKLGVINYVFNSNIDYKKIDFIMILDAFTKSYILDMFINKGLEIVVYGVIGKINNYNANLKYITEGNLE